MKVGTLVPPVVTENSVRSENKEVPIIREIMVATTMSSLFVALFALVASSFRTRAALPAEILALRHQFAVFLWLANCYFTHDSSEFLSCYHSSMCHVSLLPWSACSDL